MAGGPTARVADLVIPVKELRLAKTRLAPASAAVADPDDPAVLHARLALALAADTLAAVLASAVRRVAVVTPDPRVAGLAPDGGLYVPDAWPTLSHDEIAALAGLSYVDTAVAVMAPFVEGALTREELRDLCATAYGRFAHAAVAPLV